MGGIELYIPITDGRVGVIDASDPRIVHILDGRGFQVGYTFTTTTPTNVGRWAALQLATVPDATVKFLSTLTDAEWQDAINFLWEHCHRDHPGFKSTPSSPSAAVASACLEHIKERMPNLNIPA